MKCYHFKDDCETIAIVAANSEEKAMRVLDESLGHELNLYELECVEIPPERWHELVTFDECDVDTGNQIQIPIHGLMDGVDSPQIIT